MVGMQLPPSPSSPWCPVGLVSWKSKCVRRQATTTNDNYSNVRLCMTDIIQFVLSTTSILVRLLFVAVNEIMAWPVCKITLRSSSDRPCWLDKNIGNYTPVTVRTGVHENNEMKDRNIPTSWQDLRTQEYTRPVALMLMFDTMYHIGHLKICSN